MTAAIRSMEQNGGGQIVNLSSSQGFYPIPWLLAYSASKVINVYL
jgi:short-subunit dehydrogenase